LLVFLDHCVPDSVADVFRTHGHKVVFLREWLPTDSPDALVAAVSENEGAVLVTVDGDFRRHVAPRIPIGARARFRKLSHIRLECPEPQAANRLKAAMSFIQAELTLALDRSDKRMILSIGINVLRSYR
jgi:predicted nuclease of predicted toxin-antitoxin system